MTGGSTTRRVAVWGLGRHAVAKILPAIAAANSVELYGVCSRDAGRVRAESERWQCRGWTEPDAMLGDAGVDVVYVATPTALHAEHGRQVLGAGKHLWCEKPLTITLTDALDLVTASSSRGLALAEGFMYLHHPQFGQLSGYLSSGRLGALKSVECRFGLPPLDMPGFRSNPALGGGALFDVGCYPISAIHALFPDASARIAVSRVWSGDASGIDTDGYAAIELSNGILAVLEWRRNTAYRNEIGVWGASGSLFTDKIFSKPPAYLPVFRFRDGRGDESTEPGQPGDHYVAMLDNFSTMTDDPEAIAAERRRIVWRAEVMQALWDAADRQPGFSKTSLLSDSPQL
jgi:NDP-hexose-3-ketoreductase